MENPRFVPIEAVLEIHHRQISAHGGSRGLRSREGLESALARPKQKFSYGAPALSDLAAAYAFGIAKGHPFVDGNKRTAFKVADTFLRMNGRKISAPQEEIVQAMVQLAASEISEEGFATWVDTHLADR